MKTIKVVIKKDSPAAKWFKEYMEARLKHQAEFKAKVESGYYDDIIKELRRAV